MQSHDNTPTQAPRTRGRPKKPADKTPVDVAEFDAIAAAIKAIPPDKPGAPGRNAARDAARAQAARDSRLSRSALVLYGGLLDELRWAEGRCCYSNQWFADECDMDRTTIRRGFGDLHNAGHTLRRPLSGGFAETTLPSLVKAWEGVGAGKYEVGAEKSDGVGAGKCQGGGEFAPYPLLPL